MPHSNSELNRQLVSYILRAFPFEAAPPELPQSTEETWHALLERARLEGLTLLLFASLEKTNAAVPEFVHETLQTQVRLAALANGAAYHELDAVLPEFSSANIPVIVLKGAALAKWLYPAPNLRSFSDLDLFIRQRDVARLSAILRARGYDSNNELAAGFQDAFYSEMTFYRLTPPRVSLDVHWHLFVPLYFRRRIDPEWFWERAEIFSFGGATARVFNPTAQLVHLAVHASLNHKHTPRLIWLYDLALLLARKGDELDWHAAAAFAQQAGLARSMFEVLTQMQEVWSVRAPKEMYELFRPPHSSLKERIAFALTAAEHNQARALSDALSAPTWRGKVQYGWRHLFPDANFMRRHYGVQNDLLLPVAYARRLGTSAWKFTRSVWSSLR